MIRYGRPDSTGRTILLAVAFAIGAVIGIATTPARADGRYIPAQSADPLQADDPTLEAGGAPDRDWHDDGAARGWRDWRRAPGNALPREWPPHARAELAPWQLRDMLRRQGFHRIAFTRHRGPFVGAVAYDRHGQPVRLKVDAFTGGIVAVARLDGFGPGHGYGYIPRERYLY